MSCSVFFISGYSWQTLLESAFGWMKNTNENVLFSFLNDYFSVKLISCFCLTIRWLILLKFTADWDIFEIRYLLFYFLLTLFLLIVLKPSTLMFWLSDHSLTNTTQIYVAVMEFVWVEFLLIISYFCFIWVNFFFPLSIYWLILRVKIASRFIDQLYSYLSFQTLFFWISKLGVFLYPVFSGKYS